MMRMKIPVSNQVRKKKCLITQSKSVTKANAHMKTVGKGVFYINVRCISVLFRVLVYITTTSSVL